MLTRLINQIRENLCISYDGSAYWLCNLIYSLAGKQALASLWDISESGSDISVVHFRNSVDRTFRAYSSIFPQMKACLPDELEPISKEIYARYIRTGHFYHSTNHVAPVLHTASNDGELSFHRGIAPSDRYAMSGLGFYSRRIEEDIPSLSAWDMFELSLQDDVAFIDQSVFQGGWNKIEWPDDTEFLNLSPAGRKYWRSVAEKNGDVSLARFKDPIMVYVLYRFSEGCYWVKPIPERSIFDYRSEYVDPSISASTRYFNLANVLLMRYNKLPNSEAKIDGDHVKISLGYHLPVELNDLLMLYSWPVDYSDTGNPFNRIMTLQVYYAIKNILGNSGFQIVEV